MVQTRAQRQAAEPKDQSAPRQPAPAPKKAAVKPRPAKRPVVVASDDEEDNDPAPPPKKRAAKPKPAKKPWQLPEDEDDDGPAPASRKRTARSTAGNDQERPIDVDGAEEAALGFGDERLEAVPEEAEASEVGKEGQPIEIDSSKASSRQSKAKGIGKGKGKAGKQPVKAVNVNKGAGFIKNAEPEGEEDFFAPRDEQHRVWLKADGSDYDPPTVWKGALPLGSGSFGTAYVYYCENDDGTVKDRVVVKPTWTTDRSWWRDWTRWWGDPRDRNGKEVMEMKAMKDMQSRAAVNRCVVHRGSTLYEDLFMYRIIMNYCPLGSMEIVFPDYPEFSEPEEGEPAVDYDTIVFKDSRDVPEPLVWKWLEDLAKACGLMEEGVNVSKDPSDPAGHRVILHRDIKPGNIFLDLASDTDGDWPAYPIATLGDFGGAIYTHEDDDDNPLAYNFHEGTPGFRPVELEVLVDGTTKRPKAMGKLGSASNIWAIGQSIISLCNRDKDPRGNPDYSTRNTCEPVFNVNAKKVYSKKLLGLLARCTRYLPENRISPDELLEEIASFTAGTADGVEDSAQAMRARKPMDNELDLQYSQFGNEHYKVGLAADDYKAQLIPKEVEVEAEVDAEAPKKGGKKGKKAAAKKALKKAPKKATKKG